jgi:hypothetical protein
MPPGCDQAGLVDEDAAGPADDAPETGVGSPAFVRLGSNTVSFGKSAGMTLDSLGEAMSGPDGDQRGGRPAGASQSRRAAW